MVQHVQQVTHTSARLGKAARLLAPPSLLCILIIAAGCGSGTKPVLTNGPLSGNWQLTLNRHANATPLTFSGFLLQSEKSLSGSLLLGDGCSGVGSVTGTVDGQSVLITVNELGQDLNLTGTIASDTGQISGEFSTLAGGCTQFASTGTWSAVAVKPLAGDFHGTLTSFNGTLDVTGKLEQGPNTGGSTATLSGTITATGTALCSYLTTATIKGVISGTTISLDFYDANGAIIGQMPSTLAPATVTPDGTSLSGGYSFSFQSGSCSGDIGTLQVTFP
jgi:hypothetical protein